MSTIAPNGTVTARTVVNGAATATEASVGAPQGSYVVLVEEATGPNFTGSVIGTLSVAVQSGSTAFSVAQGSAAATLRITPDNVVLAFGQSLGLGVAGATSSGAYTFLTPSTVTYAAAGSTATVNSNGVVLASSIAGTTSVTATYSPASLSATAVVNVETASIVHSKWTVMVYLNASNDLYPYALPNVQQMSSVAYNSDVRFVVQWKESSTQAETGYPLDFNGTRRYLVTSSPPSGSSIPGRLIQDLGTSVDMGNVATLQSFVTWTKQNYPADHYACVVWDHGSGWSPAIVRPPKSRVISLDSQYGTAINTWDLPQAFNSQPVDILSFDACLMQMIEVADDLKSACTYIAASEENTPGPGYPYDRVFGPFANNPTGSVSALAQSFVTGHIGNPPYQSLPVTQSVVQANQIAGIEPALDALAGALIAERANILTEIPIIRNSMQVYAAGDGYYYYDMVDLANHLIADPKIPSDVQTAAQGLIKAVEAAVVWEGHSTFDAQSHGLAVDFSPSTNPDLSSYSNLNIAKTTRWLDWLKIAP